MRETKVEKMLPVIHCKPQLKESKNNRVKSHKEKEMNALPSIIKERRNEVNGKKKDEKGTPPILPVMDLYVRFHDNSDVGLRNSAARERLPKVTEKVNNSVQINEDQKSEGKVENGNEKKNHAMHYDLAFEQFSQNISRTQYSYFKRIPSPPPLKKKEKLHKTFEEGHYSEKHESMEKCQDGLRSQEEYELMRNKLQDIQRQFVRRHKIK
jgi:hypothetical protein